MSKRGSMSTVRTTWAVQFRHPDKHEYGAGTEFSDRAQALHTAEMAAKDGGLHVRVVEIQREVIKVYAPDDDNERPVIARDVLDLATAQNRPLAAVLEDLRARGARLVAPLKKESELLALGYPYSPEEIYFAWSENTRPPDDD